MKKIVTSNKLAEFVDQQVTLNGWIFNLRSSGKIAFLQFRDGYGFIQAIVEKSSVGDKAWSDVQKLTIESSVTLTGKVAKHPKKEEYELQVSDLKVHQIAEEYPIGQKEHGPDFLLDNRHLWLRSKRQWAIQRVRNTVINAIFEYFNKNNFIKIDSPILTPNACEGTTTLFAMDYFDLGQAYLSHTGQLYLEAAIMAHSRVFDFGPTFRAEKSKTRRHLTEFWMMDAEAAFCDHQCNMDTQEKMICHIVEKVLNNNKKELEILERNFKPLKKVQSPFPIITHAEAVKRLQEKGSKIGPEDDFGAEDETMIAEDFDRPIFIEKFPTKIKAFYMKRDPEDETRVLGDDLIAPEGYGELIGGSQREDDYDLLLQRIKEEKLPLEDFQWYLDLRKYGSVVHSGFGLGLERTVGWICGTKHVRETIPFPRMIHRLKP